MKPSKLSFYSIGILLLVSVALLIWNTSAFAANMCQVIRLEPDKTVAGTKIGIMPERITVPKSTCIVWINWFQTGKVQVSFRENAKACMISAEAPVGFLEQELKEGQSCYTTRELSQGETASLYFRQPGVYKYTVEYIGQTTGGAGDIIPRQPTSEGVIEVK